MNTTGNDSWTGNSSTHIDGTDIGPKATIQNGADTVESGGTVYVAEGTYKEHVTINQNLNLIGESLAGTILDGTQNGRPLTINSGLTVIITNFTITNGNVTGTNANGGGIYNDQGTLTITNCNINNNTATATATGQNAYAYGGGIYNNQGTLTITNCNINNNTATATTTGSNAFAYAYGGGIYNNFGTLTITNCNINNNTATATTTGSNAFAYAYGGGIYNNQGTLTITNCNINNNTATATSTNPHANGGGIYNNFNTLNITRCNINNNTATARTSNGPTAYGGGIYNNFGTLTITNCNINNNTATATTTGQNAYAYGGGIYTYFGTLTITNCNINNNTATATSTNPHANGGGIYNNQGTLAVNFSRIVNNSPYAISRNYGAVSSLEDNWWGSNNPDFTSLLVGVNSPTNWLYMTINATPSTINNTQTSLITVSFNNYSSDGTSSSQLDPTNGHIPDEVPVTFSLIGDILGSLMEPLTVTTTNGTASILFTAYNTGIQQINATTDNQNVSAYVTINPASFVDISNEFRDLPWGSVISTAYYNDKIYAIVKVHNLGPDATSINVRDLLNGLTWTGNYYVYRTVGPYPNTESAWVLNDPDYTFNGTDWNAGNLSTMIGSSRWLAIEVVVNQTGTVSNYAETFNQSTSPYRGYANYTAYLTAVAAPTSLTVNSPSGYNGDTVNITATLTDTTHNTPITNKTITITVNGETHTDNTDNNGQITWNYTIHNMNAQNYTINAIFTGDNQYNASNANGTLTVNLISTNLTVDDVSGNKNKTVPLTAILTDNHGTPLTGKTVEFWIDGAKVGENTTDNTGTAIFNYKITETPGNHILKAIFNETTIYQASNATGLLYVPTANLYIQINSDSANPTVGEKFTVTYKLGNKGPDTADNVTVIIPVPEGFHILQIYGDGNWTVNTNGTITWTFNNVTVGDPYLHLYGYASGEGYLPFTASIFSDTYNLNTIGVNSLTIHTIPQTTPEANAATTQTTSGNTVGMQSTGTPIAPLAIGILSVLGGLAATRKKQ
nr:Ig-like domain-containing protein [uncultured Methanobacterium sp.]